MLMSVNVEIVTLSGSRFGPASRLEGLEYLILTRVNIEMVPQFGSRLGSAARLKALEYLMLM